MRKNIQFVSIFVGALLIVYGVSWKLYMKNPYVSNIVSIATGLFSIFIGVIALIQAKRYNSSSEKINEETKIMLKQIDRNNIIIYELMREEFYKGKINVNKDEMKFYKTTYNNSYYDKASIIIDHFNPFMKEMYRDSIKEWLKGSDRDPHISTLKSSIDNKKIDLIEELQRELSRLGILCLTNLT